MPNLRASGEGDSVRTEAHRRPPDVFACSTGFCRKKTLLLRKPLPCSPTAEAAIQPLIRCSGSLQFLVFSSPEECFCSQTRATVACRRPEAVRDGTPESRSSRPEMEPGCRGGVHADVHMRICRWGPRTGSFDLRLKLQAGSSTYTSACAPSRQP